MRVDAGYPAWLRVRESAKKPGPPCRAGCWVFVLGKIGDDMLRFYFEVARTAYRRQLLYRWANLAGLLTNIFFGAILSYVMIALFHARPLPAPHHFPPVLPYLPLSHPTVLNVPP